MKVFITSCGRPDLLERTIESFIRMNFRKFLSSSGRFNIVVHEDSNPVVLPNENTMNYISELIETRGIGQHKSIEAFLERCDDEFYIHLEEDWNFENNNDWIRSAIEIMQNDKSIIKVICRIDSEHPCIHNKKITLQSGEICEYGILTEWTGPDGIHWPGFTWNPGVTRPKYLKKAMPFGRKEQDVAWQIDSMGYRVAELKIKSYKHIGDGRSTH